MALRHDALDVRFQRRHFTFLLYYFASATAAFPPAGAAGATAPELGATAVATAAPGGAVTTSFATTRGSVASRNSAVRTCVPTTPPYSNVG